MKGALERVLQQSKKYSLNGMLHPLNAKKEKEFLEEANEIGRKGLRGMYLFSTKHIYIKRKSAILLLLHTPHIYLYSFKFLVKLNLNFFPQ